MVTEKRPMNHAGYMSNLIRRGTTDKLYNKYIRAIKTQLIKEQHNLNINAIHGEKYILFINKYYICFFFPFFIIIELKKILTIINFTECTCSDRTVKQIFHDFVYLEKPDTFIYRLLTNPFKNTKSQLGPYNKFMGFKFFGVRSNKYFSIFCDPS